MGERAADCCEKRDSTSTSACCENKWLEQPSQLDSELNIGPFLLELELEGHMVTALKDSGSNQTLVEQDFVRTDKLNTEKTAYSVCTWG